jgi:hypothetical protein
MRFSRLHVPSFLGGGGCALTAVFMWLALFAMFSGGAAKPKPRRPTPLVGPGKAFPAPFEFEVISVDTEGSLSGPTVTVKLRTGEVVANKATRADLVILWWHLRPSIDKRSDELIDADPANPLVWNGRRAIIALYRHDDLWAVITGDDKAEFMDLRDPPSP